MNLMRDKYIDIDTDLSSLCLVSDMKIDHIFQIGSLYTDCKWVSRMKCESYQSSSLRWRISTLNSCINFELEHSTLSAIKPYWMLSTRLRSFHDRNPLIIIGEQRQIKKWGWGVGLCGYWQLS